jgi:hypothetical protein
MMDSCYRLLAFLKVSPRPPLYSSLTPHHGLTPVAAEKLSKVFPIGNGLEPKYNGSQLKDAAALQVFTLENRVALLANGNLHEALYFLSIVVWRVTNHSLNITREGRIRLLGIAFEVGRKCADACEHCDLPHRCSFGETTFFCRIEDI